MTTLSEVDCDVLLAKGTPRPMFVVIRPNMNPLTPEVCELIRKQWDLFTKAHPEANLPPAVVLPKGWDIEAVYPPNLPEEQGDGLRASDAAGDASASNSATESTR